MFSVPCNASGALTSSLPNASEGESVAETVWVQIQIFLQFFGLIPPSTASGSSIKWLTSQLLTKESIVGHKTASGRG